MGQGKTIALVLGGTRSGKSRYAQELAAQFERVTYLVTARPSDSEMRQRIAAHRRERPRTWRTVRAFQSLPAAIGKEGRHADVLVIDCLALYLDNIFNARGRQQTRVQQDTEALCTALRKTPASVIAVSNEVGCGIVPAFRSGRIYRDLLGELNQRIAAVADRVILMVAGLPWFVKGAPN